VVPGKEAPVRDCEKQGSDRAWYVVYTRPRQEPLARDNLERQGYITYLPLIRQARRRSGRRVYLVEALFPRYLFIHLNTCTDNWAPIRSTIGVSTLVHFGFRPATLSDELVSVLRVRENAQGLHERASEYRPGNRIRIEEGPMLGCEGIFLATSGRERVVVLLEIMGKEARVQVSGAAIGLSSQSVA